VKTSRRRYVELVADEQPLRLLAVFSRHEADADETAGSDDADDNITNQQQTTTAARDCDATTVHIQQLKNLPPMSRSFKGTFRELTCGLETPV